MNPFIQQLLNKARNTAVRAATGFEVQTRRNMGPQIRRALGFEALNPYSNPIVSAAKKDPSLLTAATKGALVFPGVRASGGLLGGAMALDAANQTGLTGAIEGGLNQVGPGLDRFFGAVIPKPVQNFGKSMEQYGWGALGGLVPGEISAASTPIKGSAPSLRNYGPNYKARELAAGAAAERFRPGAGFPGQQAAGFPGQQAAADRSYQSAKAETAAMVATDPLMQQWSAAQKAKDFATADQLGKQIWQNKYGGGLMGQPGGVIGSRNPLMERTFGYQTGMSPGDISQTITNPAAVPVGPGEAPYQVGDLGTGALGDAGYDPVRYGVDVEEIKKRLLQQAAAK